MISPIDVERAARSLAEMRVPGSTRAGGHYHLSEAWRAMLQRQVRAELERAAAKSIGDAAAGEPLAA